MMNRLLRGIGTNINQIAKVANSTHEVPSAALLVDMHQDVQVLRNNLQPLWDETRDTLWRS
jgi:acetolactate synthase regulatory subunit